MVNYQSNLRHFLACIPKYYILYDEERLEWGSGLRRNFLKKRLGLPRIKRLTGYLLLVDLVLVGLLLHSLEPLITLLYRNQELFGHQISIPFNRSSDLFNQPNEAVVPRILHQTCANDTIPGIWVSSQQSCIEAYSDFEYKLWTDERAREFLLSEYPWFLSTWDDYPFAIQRADSIRYFVLHHYGGIYMDMDTICNKTLPLQQIEPHTTATYALLKTSLPTGITNDFMVSSARHPAFAAAITRLPSFHEKTRFWARLQPYTAIMLSSGPLFLTLAVKDYLLGRPFLPSPTVETINSSELAPYITDLETASWHHRDAQILMWLGDKPWAWFVLGMLGLGAGMYTFNYMMARVLKALYSKSCLVWFVVHLPDMLQSKRSC